MENMNGSVTVGNIMDQKTQTNVGATPKKKIRLPPYAGLKPAIRERHRILSPLAIATLVLIGFLAAAAFVTDLYIYSHRVLAPALVAKTPADLFFSVTTATNRYRDPLKRFSIAQPPGWTARFGGTNDDFDAKLEGPDRLELYIVVADAPGETIANLKKTFADTEQETSRMTHIEDAQFQGRPAIRRYCRMDINALRSLDFLVGDTSFHLMAMIPREHFESHSPVVDALMETIQPAKN